MFSSLISKSGAAPSGLTRSRGTLLSRVLLSALLIASPVRAQFVGPAADEPDLDTRAMVETMQSIQQQEGDSEAPAPTAQPSIPRSLGFTPGTDWAEDVSEGEAALFQQIADEINALQRATAEKTGAAIDRGFHAKQHAVVKARFKVRDDLPEFARQGIFAETKEFEAWARFSNGVGHRQKDSRADVRGLAVKVLGTTGNRLFDDGGTSQDFLSINHKAQPARDLHQFMSIVRATASPLTLPFKLSRMVGVREAARIIGWVAANLGKSVGSIAGQDYFSALPVKFGPYAIQYGFRSTLENPPRKPWFAKENYLRTEFAERLRGGEVRFEFVARFYTDTAATPIEDAAVAWEGAEVVLADLIIPSQDIDSAQGQADEAEGNALSFTPWHGVEDHRPLGQLMRVRKLVYDASADLREHRAEP